MAMESTIGLAVAMGRTLVMPPQKKMYLLSKTDQGQQHHFSFVDFFPIEEMAQDNQAFSVVSMKEYLETEGMKGNLINKVSKKHKIPKHTFIQTHTSSSYTRKDEWFTPPTISKTFYFVLNCKGCFCCCMLCVCGFPFSWTCTVDGSR
jgi:GDP-fucose protein O-fucosyltransferase